MGAEFSLPNLINEFWGSSFEGELKMWSRKTKKTSSYRPNDIPRLVRDIEKRKHTEDLYLGLSTQATGLKPIARGSNETAVSLPGIFADIDFAEAKNSTKHYPPDSDTALDLIQSFEVKPFLVQHSGNGLHVLYAFDKSMALVNRDERRRAQAILRQFYRKLADHFERAGYEIDNVSDLARVFRVPMTFNHKSGTPKPVAVITYSPEERLSLSDLERELPQVDGETPKAASAKPADHSVIRQECPWYSHFTGDGAAAADEPNWYGAASITSRCKDGERSFHEYSARHPGYSPREADKKLRRALEEAGPRTCDSIRSELGNERFCDGCPHRGSITSPIQLGIIYDPGPTGPRALGFTKEGHYALLDPVRKIVILASAQQLLAEQYLLGLAESGFWRQRFPGRRGANFKAAGETLIKACRRAGPFNPLRIRGRGIWPESGEVIVNLGQPIESSKFLYLCFERIVLDNDGPPFDAERLRSHLELYHWRNSQDAGLLFGWLAMAPICGALVWRPHAFVYGPARSGKTTIHTVASIVLSPLAISADGQSTEAGIRQTLGPDSLPILLDEFESDQNGSTLRNILRLARSASSADTPVLKGTPEGKAMSFSLRTTFLFSAINPRGMSPADQSRISMFELLMHNNDREVAKRIAQDETYFRTTGSAWCSHMIGLAHLVQPAADAIDIHLVGDRRHRQNMSILIGAGFVALNSRIPTDEEARALAAEYAPAIEQHALEVERDDAQECLDYLLSHVTDGYPLGHWLACVRDEQQRRGNDFADAERIVASYGMRVNAEGEAAGFYIANGAPATEGVFQGTQWAQKAWERALRKLEGAFTPRNPVQFKVLGKKRALGIPLSYLPDEPLPFVTKGPY
ncbi:hypothetical protein EJ074_16585 [Mesorhizobium sp. M3A.F.Ca.ET.080.04.2.1]|uniref:hypothetical protein n=1 Tax=Mesorhizobium sp. M3A.F.Ca.ET.080.04.2.1 TaxID=2493676 RepID=UPI000F75951F|nr:hypothetical protein [Mesorhizobium sp. M3A.F.Ca.ET.080.04.2.1]AZO10567.1 hypothetical protein EJ074_16585 [Mesorhizobium sp. M3A.F.Ca.ET.080.04.2.1]RWF25662.1 MAG: hypothetical protein EOS64_03845 [Mesorhizobium sp.]